MNRFLFLFLLLLLVSCSGDPKQQLARCVFDAETIHPNASWLAGDARQDYVWLCMAAYGYAMSPRLDGCAGPGARSPDAVLYAQCYAPSARLASLLYRLEKSLGR